VETKKSVKLFLACCGVIAFLVAPGIVAADIFVFPDNPNGVGAFRNFGNLTGYEAALACVSLTNAVQLPDPTQVVYTPLNNHSPGWITYLSLNPVVIATSADQHTYIIDLPSPTGGQLPEVPYLSPYNGALSGLLVLSDANLTLPTTLSGWEDPTFLSQVEAIVAFVPGVSTAVVYENCQPVPIPGALLLLGSGLIGLVGMRRMIKK
jgi:hypothetical protein